MGLYHSINAPLKANLLCSVDSLSRLSRRLVRMAVRNVLFNDLILLILSLLGSNHPLLS